MGHIVTMLSGVGHCIALGLQLFVNSGTSNCIGSREAVLVIYIRDSAGKDKVRLRMSLTRRFIPNYRFFHQQAKGLVRCEFYN
jgi:hypothetical protein